MILHQFTSTKFAVSFNRRRERLFIYTEMVNGCGFNMDDEYWAVNSKEELLCVEEDIEDYRRFHDFSDDND